MKIFRPALHMEVFCALTLLALCVSAARAEETVVTILAGDTPALALTIPAKAKVYTNPPKTMIVVSGLFMSVWNVPAAKTAAEALSFVADTVKDEILQFAARQPNGLTVAGAPALELVGAGTEAEDGDPSSANIVIFAAGERVFMASVHGEHNDADRERQPMLSVLATAKTP